MSKKMISSYNIKLNPKYGELIHGLDSGNKMDTIMDSKDMPILSNRHSTQATYQNLI